MDQTARPTLDEANQLLEDLFADWVRDLNLRIEHIDDSTVVMRLPFHDRLCRVGGIVCGQASMALIDTCMVFVCFTGLGRVADVTTVAQSTSFLRAARGGDLIATGRVLKAGRSLVFGDVSIAIDGDARPVATGSSTYAVLPPT